MLSVAAVLLLASLGYVIDQDDKKKSITGKALEHKSVLENPNEVPSSDSIHHNRFLSKVSHDTLRRATNAYVDAQTGDYLYRDIPETNWNKRRLSKHHKFLQTEEDVASSRVPKTTSLTFNDASYDAIQKSNAAAYTNLQGLNDTMSPIESFNDRLNRLPNPTFDTITDSNCNGDIIKTTKHVREWNKGHNNMVPFFGSKTTQNTDPYATEAFIERSTGSAPLYDHKKETNLFFKPIQNRWMDGEVKADLELSRYNTSRHQNNVLPFAQMRVNTGVGLHPMDNEPIHGYHDTWRPTGRAEYQDVNKLRVNPRFTFQNDYQTGAGFYQTQSTAKTATGDVKARLLHRKGVWNNEFIDQKKEHFATTSANHLKEDKFRVRELLRSKAQGYDAPMNAGVSVIQLKEDADRGQCRPKLGPAYENRGSTSHFDVARQTVAETTEDNLYDRINPLNTEANRGSTHHFDEARNTVSQTTKDGYPTINPLNVEANRGSTAHFDRARETVAETTEDNLYERINAHDYQRGITYYFDKAKERIAQLTQDNPYARVFPAHEKMGTTWWFDTAKETVAETTEEHPDPRINPRSQQQDNTQHYGTFECGSLINGLKEDAIAVNRLPTPVGVQNTPNATNIGEYDVFHRQQFSSYDNTKKFEPINQAMNISKELIGTNTNVYANNCYPKDTEIMGNRIDPYNVQQHQINPFSQSLAAWNIPYNQKYPIIP